ncbi:MAG: SDR family oxidoreductase [Candidatus Devosia euplotis]|nr:SDR family oxidoreductase [Candidatus Devosia euplotis]
MAKFADKIALVTGTGGIARAVALRLAQDGARVLALSVDAMANDELAKAAQERGLGISVRRTDVSVAGEVESAMAELSVQFGSLDIIVNVSSVQGQACQANVAAYVATKGAVHALTRAMALDFAVDRIRVTSVSPGSVRTPILERAARAVDGPDADIDAAFADLIAILHPIVPVSSSGPTTVSTVS